MTIEQNLKTIIGEQAFQLAVLSSQLEEANKKLQELQTKETTNADSN